jgi:hypothetical protein
VCPCAWSCNLRNEESQAKKKLCGFLMWLLVNYTVTQKVIFWELLENNSEDDRDRCSWSNWAEEVQAVTGLDKKTVSTNTKYKNDLYNICQFQTHEAMPWLLTLPACRGITAWSLRISMLRKGRDKSQSVVTTISIEVMAWSGFEFRRKERQSLLCSTGFKMARGQKWPPTWTVHVLFSRITAASSCT